MKQTAPTKRVALALILLLAAGLALAAGRLWHDHRVRQSDQQQLSTMQRLITSLQGQVAAQFPATEYKTSLRIWYGENVGPGTAVAVSGYDYKLSSSSDPQLMITAAQGVDYDQAEALSNAPAHPIDDVYNVIVASLRDAGFRPQPPQRPGMEDDEAAQLAQMAREQPGGNITTTTFVQGNKTCTVQKNTAFYELNMGCGSTDADADLALQIAPFAKLYAAATKTSLKGLELGPLTVKSQNPIKNDSPITASETPGYDIAELIVRKGSTLKVALFYAKGKSWHYVTQAGDEFGFDCTPIWQNPDARKALHDQICYDFKDDSGQIRVDSSRRALQ